MAVLYSTAAKDNRMTAVRDLLNSGTLEIGTTAMGTVLASIPLDASSGTISAGVLTLAGMPKTVAAAATGTAAEARLRTSVAADVITTLSVGLAATDVILDSIDFTVAQDVTINSASITHAA